MRIEIYSFNEKKLLQEAQKIGMTPTQFVNFLIDKIIIEQINISIKYEEGASSKFEQKNIKEKTMVRL